MEITSSANAKVKAWAKLKEKKYRDRYKQFLVEGEHLIIEAQQAGCLHTLLVCKGYPHLTDISVPVYEVTEEIIHKLSTLTSKEAYIGICDMPHFQAMDQEKLIVLDGVQDPGNLGTIIRSAVSFGYDGIILSDDCVDAYNEKVIRATQGAIFYFPIQRQSLCEYLPELKKQGFYLYATALQNAVSLSSIVPQTKHAIVFGNEGNGVRKETVMCCDTMVKIEMKRFESLNVAVAAGICMYYLTKE